SKMPEWLDNYLWKREQRQRRMREVDLAHSHLGLAAMSEALKKITTGKCICAILCPYCKAEPEPECECYYDGYRSTPTREDVPAETEPRKPSLGQGPPGAAWLTFRKQLRERLNSKWSSLSDWDQGGLRARWVGIESLYGAAVEFFDDPDELTHVRLELGGGCGT